jgi:hypothetical protein
MFRGLKASEIECRVSQIKGTWLTLLLYKDARCDMNILDETVTPFGWKREHSRDNANCTVSIYSEDLEQWIGKEDTGSESNTEKAKGLASDSFKRACFNWGIGRELYTAPHIKIKPIDDKEFFENSGRFKTWSKFHVHDIEIINNVITFVQITDQNGKVRFTEGNIKQITKKQHKELQEVEDDKLAKWLTFFKCDDIESMTYRNAKFMIEKLKLDKDKAEE